MDLRTHHARGVAQEQHGEGRSVCEDAIEIMERYEYDQQSENADRPYREADPTGYGQRHRFAAHRGHALAPVFLRPAAGPIAQSRSIHRRLAHFSSRSRRTP